MYRLEIEPIEESDLRRQVAICRLADGRLTARGVGQRIPGDCVFIGSADLIFALSEDDANLKNADPRELEPIGIETDIKMFPTRTEAKQSWVNNSVMAVGKDEFQDVWDLVQYKVVLAVSDSGRPAQAQWTKNRRESDIKT